MDSLRTKKVARLIQKELGLLFQEETRKTSGIMVSVVDVRLTPDLSSARVYLSIFPDEKAEELLASIKENRSLIRYDFGKRVGTQLRHIPELIFEKDLTMQYARRIDELLSTIPSKKETDIEEN